MSLNKDVFMTRTEITMKKLRCKTEHSLMNAINSDCMLKLFVFGKKAKIRSFGVEKEQSLTRKKWIECSYRRTSHMSESFLLFTITTILLGR
jgi:hypothetical protein